MNIATISDFRSIEQLNQEFKEAEQRVMETKLKLRQLITQMAAELSPEQQAEALRNLNTN